MQADLTLTLTLALTLTLTCHGSTYLLLWLYSLRLHLPLTTDFRTTYSPLTTYRLQPSRASSNSLTTYRVLVQASTECSHLLATYHLQVDVHASVGPLETGGTHETGGSYVRPALASTQQPNPAA